MPLEYGALGLSSIDPWSGSDSLVYSKLMSYDLANDLDNELERYYLLVNRSLSYDRVNELIPSQTTDLTILSQEDLLQSNLPTRTLMVRSFFFLEKIDKKTCQ